MSKKRRTRKEKMSATARQDFSAVFQLPTIQPIRIATEDFPSVSAAKPTPVYLSRSYTYVTTDIRQTLSITTILIALNIAIFIILKLKLVNLFGIMF